MTVFVVSLFLPKTINFNLPATTVGASSRPSAVSLPRRPHHIDIFAKPSLFQVPNHLTPPSTPAVDKDTEEFFKQKSVDIRKHGKAKSDVMPTTHVLPNAVTTDLSPPAWGSGKTLMQPRSRASSPPPASVLQHNKTREKAEKLGRLGIRQPQLGGRSESHDRVFAEAEWTVESSDQGNGGLRNAVNAAIRTGDVEDPIWVGTLGMPTDALEGTQRKIDIDEKLASEYNCQVVTCKDSDFDGHYSHYCKQILWPVFHYQIPDNPKSKAYEDHSWVFYVAVNQAFADVIVKNWKRGDVVWVHDYHLLLVPSMVRKKLPDAKIGFFLHVAFPSSEIFRCIAVRRELLEGMLGANLIGFQIPEYARHFLQTCSRLLNVEATSDGVQLEDRFVNVIDLPIGIDPVALSQYREEEDVTAWMGLIKERYKGKKLIVARDKLDYVRGVRPKLLAYELFLHKYPEWRGKVTMLQVATSTTEQPELDASIADIVNRVNSTWSSLEWHPLIYLKQDINYAQYLAMLTVADALVISSQREGMNLTSHEFVFCQDGKFEDHSKFGSLLLSEFTGSHSVLNNGELSINPWDHKQCADAISKALEMSDEEKEANWKKLYAGVMHHTAEHWFNSFLKRLDAAHDEQHRRDTMSVPRLSVQTLSQQYKSSSRRLFLLDYEGTLASADGSKRIVLNSPQRTIDVLNQLLLDERNTVYVMSGHTPEELDNLFKNVPNVGLFAENGCFVKEPGAVQWICMADDDKMLEWMGPVESIMKYYEERTPGSWIEYRNCSLIFHYKNADDYEAASRQAGDCASHINDACEKERVRAIPVEHAVCVEPIDHHKGNAAELVLERCKTRLGLGNGDSHKGPMDFLMVVGDGREDEVIFRWANELSNSGYITNVSTVSLGTRNTEAMATMTQGVTGVLTTLAKLAAL